MRTQADSASKNAVSLIMTGPGAAEVMNDLTIASPDYRQVLVKTRAVGLNTPDVLALDLLERPGAGFGFDFAGKVVELGKRLPPGQQLRKLGIE